MYTFLIGNDNYITTTNSERIVQRSKLVNTLQIFVPNEYGSFTMSDCQAIMYYQLPVSGEWKPKDLTPSKELYKDKYVEYLIPVDTWLTSEAGDVQFEIKFYNVDMGGEAKETQYVRKATHGVIHISSSKDWSSSIADSMLDAVDQRIIQLMMTQKAHEEMLEETQAIMTNKADNIAKDKDTNEIYLTSDGKEIGDRIKDECDIDGVPVIDLGSGSDTDNPDTPGKDDSIDDVVEF